MRMVLCLILQLSSQASSQNKNFVKSSTKVLKTRYWTFFRRALFYTNSSVSAINFIENCRSMFSFQLMIRFGCCNKIAQIKVSFLYKNVCLYNENKWKLHLHWKNKAKANKKRNMNQQWHCYHNTFISRNIKQKIKMIYVNMSLNPNLGVGVCVWGGGGNFITLLVFPQ